MASSTCCDLARSRASHKKGRKARSIATCSSPPRLDGSKFPPLQLDPLPGGEDSPAAAAKPEAAKEEAKPAGDEAAKKEAKPAGDEAAKEEAKPAGDEAAKKEVAKEAAKEEKTDLELEAQRIRKENQRKQDERDEKLKKANTQIAELNARFADWYYIISEDEYKKVHLGRNDLIAEKQSAAAEGFGVDALRQLEKEGLEQKKPDDSAKVPPPNALLDPGQ